MKNMKFFLFILSLIFSFSCNKDKDIDDEDLPQTFVTYIHAVNTNNTITSDADSAQILIYNNEADYLANKNVVLTDIMTAGKYKINIESTVKKDFYFKIIKGNVDNSRSRIFTNKTGAKGVVWRKTCGSCGNNEISSSLYINLYSTPVNLQLNVSNNGIPVPNAYVSIFLNEQDYMKNEWTNVYTSPPGLAYYKMYLGISQYSQFDSLKRMTNANGTVFFEQYEPRQYWFRIFKDNKSNDKTTFKTNGALPNELDVTTVIDVGIQ